jgi:thiol-disulfide isomerase/thioredoxin
MRMNEMNGWLILKGLSVTSLVLVMAGCNSPQCCGGAAGTCCPTGGGVVPVVNTQVTPAVPVAVTTPSTPVGISTLSAVYPGLTSGALSFATLNQALTNALLVYGDLRITETDLKTEIAAMPVNQREKVGKNGLFVLDNMATDKLLLSAARQRAVETKTDISGKSDKAIIQDYLNAAAETLTVTDVEVSEFYEQNKDSCGGASLEKMKDQIKSYVLQQKQQEAVSEYIRTLGQRMPIQLAAAWVKEQAALALDNPVDKARSSGKPTLVDFGSVGCRPCDMMAPILKDLEKKYEGKANVLFVHVGEQPVLAARYGIRSIPVQAFFDATGREVYRHTGFFPQPDVEKKMAELGVK